MKRTLTLAVILCCLAPLALAQGYEASDRYESPGDFPFMGDWEGQWIGAKAGHEEHDPSLAAQVIVTAPDQYRVRLMPKLYLRAEPYLDLELTPGDGELILEQGGWNANFKPEGFEGHAMLHGTQTRFTLKRVEKLSPTLGAKPPEGAIVLFDGTSTDAWQHRDGRPVTWKITPHGVLQVVSLFWNNRQNEADGLGGDIMTKQSFGSLRFHTEFRYPVEPGKHGQMRGNSGVFLNGLGELQLLNSYGLNGYWNECGSFYHYAPPKVNAAAPPLQWQTYDIDIDLPESGSGGEATVSVLHNGRPIHTDLTFPNAPDTTNIALQDHINAMQFRNMWVVEK